MTKDEQNNLLEAVAGVCIRCFVIGMVFLLIWFFMCLSCDWVYEIHSKWFALSIDEFAVVHYCGLMFAKICIFLFFLFPYIALKLMLAKKQ
jgi:hypothetical protein